MLMTITEYRLIFSPGSRPDPRTVRSWIARMTQHYLEGHEWTTVEIPKVGAR